MSLSVPSEIVSSSTAEERGEHVMNFRICTFHRIISNKGERDGRRRTPMLSMKCFEVIETRNEKRRWF
jgi:hypothetical protein